MMQKFPIKMITVVVLFGAAWIWYKASPDTAPQTVVAAQAQSSESTGVVAGIIYSDEGLNNELTEKFSAALRLIEQGKDKAAIEVLNEVIKLQPYAIEPYINLASLYAKSNNIEQASKTLKKAININENTAVLFDGLQSLYAAQAALAYQRALEINTIDDQSLSVSLPTINTLRVDKPNEQELLLKKSNQQLLADVASVKEQLDDLQRKFKGVDQERQLLLSSNNELKAQNQQQIARIEAKGDTQSNLASTLKSELQKAEQANIDLKQSHREEVTALQQKSNAQISVLQAQLEQAEIARLALLDNKGSVASVVASPESSNPEAITAQASVVEEIPVKEEDQKAVAIGLVQAWASSWAAQDVSGYVAYYNDQFRPANGLSNKQWREQRKVRLTNKTFIEVEVDSFEVEDLDTQFSVTFSQHYKANNVDDKIIKRLIFDKTNRDWTQAKIVAEQVISL